MTQFFTFTSKFTNDDVKREIATKVEFSNKQRMFRVVMAVTFNMFASTELQHHLPLTLCCL